MIVFITNYCPHYRRPVFEALSKKYDVYFMFTGRPSSNSWNDFGNFRYILCLSKIMLALNLLRVGFDVIITNFPIWENSFEFLIAKLRRKKIIFWVEEWFQPYTLVRRLLTPLLKFMARNCDAIVVCGSAAKVHMLDFGVIPEKIFLAPNASWVDLTPQRVVSKKTSKLIKQFVVLYVGRLVRLKGVDYLVKAFSMLEKEYNNIKLVIVGDGSFRSNLERLAQKLGIKDIEFIGSCDPRDRFRYFDICDVFVLPSIRTPSCCDAWGLTLNEAMQFGKPIIATDAVGSAFDLIRNGVNGFIVRNSDVESLYQALKRMLDNPPLVEAMGKESKKIVEECFTYDQMLKGFTDALAFVENLE